MHSPPSLSAGLAGIAFLLAGSAVSAPATVPPHNAASAARHAVWPRGRRRNATSPTTCSTVAVDGFVALTGESNYVGPDAAVLGGSADTACDTSDGILAGQQNKIGNGGSAFVSAIGAGNGNGITASAAMIGAGIENSVEGYGAFIGGGQLNDASAPGAFIGGGDSVYSNPFGSAGPSTPGNVASGTDSFIGAGDLNQVSGKGSFIGAGGAATPQNDGATGSTVSGSDSFIGAGEQNLVVGNTAAVVAGFRNQPSGTGAFIGAGDLNVASGAGAVVGGGGTADEYVSAPENVAAGVDSFVGAGDVNYVGAGEAFIGGGLGNGIAAGGTDAAIAGGDHNTASGAYGVVAGGYHNNATAAAAAVGGGSSSSATGKYATVPGGYLNAAGGIGSFAAGTQAKARHNGAFVWSDNSGTAAVQSMGDYQFIARASGGFFLLTNAAETSGVKLSPGSGAWASLSDRTMKTGVVALDDAAVLAKVAALPVNEWSYTSEHGVRHVGPMAQDFYAAFGVGEDDRHITSIDEDGVALAAIKALATENQGLQAQTRELHAENRDLRDRLARDAARLARDEAQRGRDDARLLALERKVDALATR